MADSKTIVEQAYSAFNRRDIDGALALMAHDVSWPKASEGGKIIGKEAIRAYWTRQWNEFDPHVEPLALTRKTGARFASRCTRSSRASKGMFFQTARSSTYSPCVMGLSRPWILAMSPVQPPARRPPSRVGRSCRAMLLSGGGDVCRDESTESGREHWSFALSSCTAKFCCDVTEREPA